MTNKLKDAAIYALQQDVQLSHIVKETLQHIANYPLQTRIATDILPAIFSHTNRERGDYCSVRTFGPDTIFGDFPRIADAIQSDYFSSVRVIERIDVGTLGNVAADDALAIISARAEDGTAVAVTVVERSTRSGLSACTRIGEPFMLQPFVADAVIFSSVRSLINKQELAPLIQVIKDCEAAKEFTDEDRADNLDIGYMHPTKLMGVIQQAHDKLCGLAGAELLARERVTKDGQPLCRLTANLCLDYWLYGCGLYELTEQLLALVFADPADGALAEKVYAFADTLYRLTEQVDEAIDSLTTVESDDQQE